MSNYSYEAPITIQALLMEDYETLVPSHRFPRHFFRHGVSGENRRKLALICPPYFGEANGETRPAVLTIFSRERPAVRFDDATRNRQPHSGPFGFCRKEWLEKLLD